jgi:hypothetical protein
MIGEQHDDKVRAEQGHTRVGDENNNGGPGLEMTVRMTRRMGDDVAGNRTDNDGR